MLEISFNQTIEMAEAARNCASKYWLESQKKPVQQRFTVTDECVPLTDGFQHCKQGFFMPASATVFMFSGQGSQYFQMGRGLYDNNNIFRKWMIRLDDMARDLCGRSVIEAIYSDGHRKADPFARTLLTHPAIFMVEYSLAQCLVSSGVLPDMVLGASLGSFAAAAVGGFIDVEDALTAVLRQAIFLEECCEPGSMIAVLADPALFAEKFLSDHSELAAINFSSHFVISTSLPELTEIEAVLKERNISYQRLPVSYAFHSRWIDNAKSPFESFMRTMRCKQGQVPLVCCQDRAVLSSLSDGYFWSVVRQPIRFHEAIEQLEQTGSHRYIDLGPAGTLATFLKYGMPAKNTVSRIHAILTPFGFDQKNLAALLASSEVQAYQ